MENLVDLRLFNDVFRGRRVLVTGHTGFKGSWLVSWLTQLGAQVAGYSLADDGNSRHYKLLNAKIYSVSGDVIDRRSLTDLIADFKPEIVFHLAAQSLVRRSYRDPVYTYQTNVIGTLNVYQACMESGVTRGVVSVTSDKVYENKEVYWPYRETDSLGGYDMYSSSKACVELMTNSFRQSFLKDTGGMVLVTGRAGNVIGGGDWAEDRLVPDAMRALEQDAMVTVRNPASVRPWQHVLEPLSGYMVLAQHILESGMPESASWNFGPSSDDYVDVGNLIGKIQRVIPELKWEIKTDGTNPHEAGLLSVDSSNARRKLHWSPVWNTDIAIEKTAAWYRSYIRQKMVSTLADIEDYVADARRLNLKWAR